MNNFTKKELMALEFALSNQIEFDECDSAKSPLLLKLQDMIDSYENEPCERVLQMKSKPKFKKGQTVYKVGALGVLDWVKIHDLRQVANSFVYGDIAGEWWHEHHLFCTDIELIENEIRYWNKLYDEMRNCEHICHDFFVRDGDVVCSLCGEIYKKVNK